jgi:uncharacterized protein
METATGEASVAYRVTSELARIPHGGNVILHAPLLGATALVNKATASLLDRLDSPSCGPLTTPEHRALQALEQAGIVNGPEVDPPLSGLRPPDSVGLFLTERCNLRCRYCYAHGGAGTAAMPREMGEDAITHLANRLADRSRSELRVHFHGGGEVTLEWELMVHLAGFARATAKERGLDCRISAGTNGVVSEKVASRLPSVLDDATISLDGLPEVHDGYRRDAKGAGSSEKVLRTIRILDEAGFRYGIRSTVVHQAVERLPESIRFVCENSLARRIKAEPAYPHGRWAGEADVRPTAFVAAFLEAQKVAREYGRELSYSGCRFPATSDIFCRAVNGSFAVTPRGLVTSCFEVGHDGDAWQSEFVYGRYDAETRSFRIDHEQQARLLRFRVGSQQRCADCFAKYYCCGDCPLKVVLEANTAPASRPRCIISRALTKTAILESLDRRDA